ncbi:LON peptidase substrate-binding domain-containing protein [Aestuariibacter halophilus]|uniref:LON peptidase substrate-binding domain-containing protein n=2 Tax=Fluctibacter halophilus TaxID=226011 RepID=A0ABS8G2D8_9ALTE|nr:LON peptidase substrate-binding domain-containing protein [Aestuariibacter halophilus]
MSNSFELPLFPLSAHVLPGGRLSLRIFEPRYVRMVKEACAAQQGFGVCMLNARGDKARNEHIYPVGTYVEVIDFDLLEDGLLGITVEGQRCFQVNNIESQPDGLRVGQCEWLDNWQATTTDMDVAPMDTRLREIFDKYPEVNALYQQPRFDDPIWIIYRWLELLPVNTETKQQLLQQKDYGTALKFLSQLVQ